MHMNVILNGVKIIVRLLNGFKFRNSKNKQLYVTVL